METGPVEFGVDGSRKYGMIFPIFIRNDPYENGEVNRKFMG
jgi:hypothetical protein